MWRCNQRKKERTTDQKSFLPLPLAAEGQQQLETRIYLASQPQPWKETLPKPSSNHSRDSRLREGSSYLRVGKDRLCYAQEELAEDQVQSVPSNNEAKEKRWGKSFSLLLTFLPRAFNVHEKFWKT